MSAFFDDRPEVDDDDVTGSARRHVRVIGLADRDVIEVTCLLWYDGNAVPRATTARLIPIGPQISPFLTQTVFEQLIFSCSVTDDNVFPVDVSLVTSYNNFRPINLLPVQKPVKLSSPSEEV